MKKRLPRSRKVRWYGPEVFEVDDIILVRDNPPSFGLTAFHRDYPNVISEGDTQEEAIANLKKLLASVPPDDLPDVEDKNFPG